MSKWARPLQENPSTKIAADAARAKDELVEGRRESKQLIAADALRALKELVEERRESKQLLAADALRTLEELVEGRRESKHLIASDALLAPEELVEERSQSKQILASDALLALRELLEERRESKQLIATDALAALKSLFDERRDSKELIASEKLVGDKREARQHLTAANNSLESLRTLVDSVVDYAVFMIDPNGFVTTWNLSAQQLKGYTRSEILGKHFSVFLTSEDVAAGVPAREIATATAEGQCHEEGWRVRKDGSKFWASVVITAVYGMDGSLLGFGKVIRDLTQRRNAEQSLASADANLNSFRILIDAVVDYAVFMLDPNGFITTWNAGAERIKGYTPAEIIGKHFSVFYTPEAIADDLPGRELRVAAVDGRYEDEGWRLRKDGSRLWANVIITALRKPDGTLIGFGKVTRDLTERRMADEALRESNRIMTEVSAGLTRSNSILRNILDASIFSAIIAADLEGVITTFNRGAELMLGYSAAEVVGKMNASALYIPEEIERRRLTISKLIGRPLQSRVEMFLICQKENGPTEWTFVHKDGHPITVTLSVSLVMGENGEPVGAMGVASDVTQKRNAAQELASAYARLNSVLDYMSDSVMTVGADWTLLYGNRRAMEMIPDLVIGKSYWQCFPNVTGTPLEQTLRTVMDTRIEASYEVFYTPYEKWYRGRIFPNESGISIFFADVTEEKKLQEQLALEQLLREKRIEALSHMAGGLAHEISNPLAIIHARASNLQSLIAGGLPIPPAELEKSCDSIVKTSDRAIRILKGLKGFGREAGNDPLEWASPYDIVEQCKELQEARFERHDVKLDLVLPPDLPLILCRETQIGQIVTNLVNNAFDAIDQSHSTERWVTVALEHLSDTISIRVTDSGPGIDEKFRPHLMDPFFTTKTLGLGMGVGLSLSRAIAHSHGGSLELLAGTPNTCFELILPVDFDSKRGSGLDTAPEATAP